MPDPAAAPLWIYRLGGGESLVVAADGSHWSVGADTAVLTGAEGAEVLAALAAQATGGAPPRIDPVDLVVDSCRELLTAAADIDRRGTGATTAVWPFAGHWHRLALAPGAAEALAQEAVACLRATVPDHRLAEILSGGAVSTPETQPVRAATGPAPVGTLMRWRPVEAEWDGHRVRPAPMLDRVTGVLHRVVPRPADPALPPGFVHVHAELPHLASADPRMQADALAPAGAFGEPESREAAILSGAEHYCGAYSGQGRLRLASLDELRRSRERTVAIDAWEPHDPALHDQPGFPFERFDADTPVWWVGGVEGGERCWAPMSLVHVGWREAGLPATKIHHGHNFTGMKAGRSVDEAAERACAHVVAHDAVAVWWAAGERVRLPLVPVPDAVERGWEGCELGLRLLAVPSTTGAPVRLAVVEDRERGIVSLGFAADRSGERAGELAVVEALIQHVSARDLDASESLIRDAEALGNGAVAGLAPHDPDRRYRDAFGPGFRGLIDPMCHVQLGLDPSVAAVVRRRTAPADHAGLQEDEGAAVRSLLEQHGHRVVIVDATADRVRAAGLRVVRAVVPGLARIQPAAFPLGPDGRVARAAAALGWAHGTLEPTPYPGW